jgi:hypothetical protein
VKIFNVKHMDFDEPAVVKEVLRLKVAHEREMERVPHFIALFRSNGAAPPHPGARFLDGRRSRVALKRTVRLSLGRSAAVRVGVYVLGPDRPAV